MTYADQYIIQEVQTQKDSARIVFRSLSVPHHRNIAEAILSPHFARSIGSPLTVKRFTVTSGGYQTPFGFQLTISSVFGDSRKDIIEYDGASYPPSINEDEFLSKIVFIHTAKGTDYEVTLFWNYLEIRPAPPRRILKAYIRGLKEALTKGPNILLIGAEEKLESATTNLLQSRFRSATHDVYYALYNIVQALAAQKGMSPHFSGHGAVPKILSEILQSIATGTYVYSDGHTSWLADKSEYQSINPSRYSKMADELCSMREEADYTSLYEAGETVGKLANIMLKVAELLDLAHSVIKNYVHTSGGKLVQIQNQERVLEPCPREIFHGTAKGEYGVMQGGLILAEDFVPSRFLIEFLSQKDVYCAHMDPSRFRDGLSVKFEKNGKQDKICMTSPGDAAAKEGYFRLTTETVVKWSEMIKQEEIERLKSKTESLREMTAFSDGGYFYEFYILADGRFYITSSLGEQKATDQMRSMLKLRELLSEIVFSVWGYSASITFLPISILVRCI